MEFDGRVRFFVVAAASKMKNSESNEVAGR
jgi:hypothetical protein